MLKPERKIVMKGKWMDDFNGKKKIYDIQIIKSNVIYGSGDDKNPWGITIDMYFACYYIEFLEELNGKVHTVR